MIDVSSFVKSLQSKPIAVFGLGVSGLSTVKAILKAGGEVAAWDDQPCQKEQAAKLGAKIIDLNNEDLALYACLVLAPGIPFTHNPHPIVQKARGAGIEILGDIEILSRIDHGYKTIGITGTNGKSTTTALIGHILTKLNISNTVGGNIGRAVLDMTLPSKDGILVLEISSYQMDLCPNFTPDIAVLLNITPDHIDRHGTLEAYAAAKERIFAGGGIAVIGSDDALSRQILEQVTDKKERLVVSVSVDGEADISSQEGHLIDSFFEGDKELFSIDKLQTLPGKHNQQNILAAYAVCRQLNIDQTNILGAIRTFPGLPHRQYLVRTIGDIAYVNDSKATNAEATAKALACYKDIYWILGGRAKDGGLEGLEPYMPMIKQAYLIGESSDEFASWLKKQNVSFLKCETLEKAAQAAHDTAQLNKKGTVLLSPACASWDQFQSFEKRGDLFAELVEKLDVEVAA